MHKNQDFIKYLSEASKTVAQWPEWKKSGSDATLSQHVENAKIKKSNGIAVLANLKNR